MTTGASHVWITSDGMWSFVVYDHRDRRSWSPRSSRREADVYAVNGRASALRPESALLTSSTGRHCIPRRFSTCWCFGGLTSSQEDLFEGVLELLPAMPSGSTCGRGASTSAALPAP